MRDTTTARNGIGRVHWRRAFGHHSPFYQSAVLLKIYIYDYFNRTQSSRGLGHENQRNVELVRLTARLAPKLQGHGRLPHI